jgi:GT2 family glycosyltransferase
MNEHMVCDIVFVTYNSEQVIGGAMERIAGAGNIVIVDNGNSSEIGVIAEVSRAKLVCNPKNVGFGAACNQGARLGSAEFILFLNPDTRAEAGEIAKLVDGARRHPDAAAFNPRILDENGDAGETKDSILCGRWRAEPAGNNDFAVSCLSGSALLVRRSVFESLGGFDENIFLYFEDDDLCRRICDAGHKLMIVGDATITHFGASSSPVTGELLWHKEYYAIRSRRYVSRKHGLAFNTTAKAISTAVRLSLAVLMEDRNRAARLRGRLSGLLSTEHSARPPSLNRVEAPPS